MKQCKFRETCIVPFVDKTACLSSAFFTNPQGILSFFFFLSENSTKASKPHDSLLMGNYWLALNILRVESS